MWKVPASEILAAVDFGDASARGVRIAGALASRFQARLTALHAEALEAPLYFTSEQIEALERQRQVARRQAQLYLDRFVRQLTTHDVESQVVDGPPVEVLLRKAAEVDLMVLGTHGRRGPSRWWLGSVAERIARASPVPVLVVHPGLLPDAPEATFRRVLVALPAAQAGGAAREYAEVLQRSFGGELLEAVTREPWQAASAQQATLLVTPVSFRAFGDTSDLVRLTSLPTLFVPGSSAG